MQTNLYNTSGKVTGKVNLPVKLFGAKENPVLMAQAVHVYLSRQRRASAKAKTRGEVNFSTRKISRQKGTGRARHGAKSAPIFVGGGVAHGPRGVVRQLVLPQKMRRAALASALSSKYQKKQIIVVEGLEKKQGKTKDMARILDSLSALTDKKKGKILLVLPEKREFILRVSRNIPGVKVVLGPLLNTYEVLSRDKIILTEESIPVLEKNFSQ